MSTEAGYSSYIWYTYIHPCCGVTRWVTDLQVSVSRIGVGTRRFWGTNTGFAPVNKAERIQFVPPMPSSVEQAEVETEREPYRHTCPYGMLTQRRVLYSGADHGGKATLQQEL